MTDTPASPTAPASGGAELTIYALLTPLVRQWRAVVAVSAVVAVLAVIVSLLMRPVFTATTSFTPQAPQPSGLAASLAGLAGLAGQLGLGSPTAGVSPEFFASVLDSRELLEEALITEFRDPETGQPRRLIAQMNVKGPSERDRLAIGVRRMRRLTSATVNGRTGIVAVSVRQPDAQLAADVANRLTDLLNRFNLERRQSQSREQARFVRHRLASAEEELREAERALLSFLQTNRQHRTSPLLTFEYTRLDRIVQLKQEVYAGLAKAYEDARIGEVRDTPVLTIVDHAVPPHRRTSPNRKLIVAVGTVIGGVIGIALAYVLDLRDRDARQGRPDYQEFRAALARARGQLARLGRRA